MALTIGAGLMAGAAAAAESLLARYYYGRTYSYYESASVYWEDQHTLLLYLPDRRLFWTLRPGIRLKAQEFIESYGPPEGQKVVHRHAWEIGVGPKGFRGSDFSWAKPASEFRVGCFGDSRTLGEGLADADTYPEQLTARLAGEVPGLTIRALNFGADGWSSTQGLRLLEREGVKASLDMAVFAFGVNDTDFDWGISDTEMARRLDSPIVTIRRNLYRSMTFYWCAREFLRMKGALFGKTPAEKAPPNADVAHARVSLDEFGRNLEHFAAVCRAHAIAPILLLLPLNPYYDWQPWASPAMPDGASYARDRETSLGLARRGELRAAQEMLRAATEKTVFAAYNREARKAAQASGVLVIDPTTTFDPAQVGGDNPFVDDMHPSASGAGLVAKVLAEVVASAARGSGVDRASQPEP